MMLCWPFGRVFLRMIFQECSLLGVLAFRPLMLQFHARSRYFSKRKLFIISNTVELLELEETLEAIYLLSPSPVIISVTFGNNKLIT